MNCAVFVINAEGIQSKKYMVVVPRKGDTYTIEGDEEEFIVKQVIHKQDGDFVNTTIILGYIEE